MRDEKTEAQKTADEKQRWITGIGVAGFLLLFVLGSAFARTDVEFLKALAPYTVLLGIVTFVMYSFLFVANSKIAKVLGGELASRAALTALIAIALFASSVDAASALNRVFGLSESAFPNTFRLLTLLNIFILAKPFFIAFTTWGAVAFTYYVLVGAPGAQREIQAFLFAVSGLIIGGASLLVISYKFDTSLYDKKTYLLARVLDFNEHVNCPGSQTKGDGVFLGAAQNRVMFDSRAIPKIAWYEIVVAGNRALNEVMLPGDLPIQECSTSQSEQFRLPEKALKFGD